MTSGALITAAGMSSRMNGFKPMLNIGSISIAQRIVASFRQAGVDKIVMVTGFNAVALERHLSGNGIIFLHNEEYESTHMFDSVKIGLDYLKDKVDVIMFSPVDVPLFTAGTVERLLAAEADIVLPEYDGETGHPVRIASSAVEAILSYDGNEGLKGAIESCGAKTETIHVNDPGILHDADTPEDYKALLEYHNGQLARPEISVSLAREVPFFDEKMAMLLMLVDETSSVRTACERMQISYSTGWNIIRTLESQLRETLIIRTQGGAKSGRSRLTEYGKNFLERYSAYSKAVKKTAGEMFDQYFGEGML